MRKLVAKREGDPAEVGFVAAAGECSAYGCGIARPAYTLGDPANGFILDLGGKLCAVLGCQLGIKRRDESLSKNGHVSRRGIHQPEVVRAGHMKAIVDQALREFG